MTTSRRLTALLLGAVLAGSAACSTDDGEGGAAAPVRLLVFGAPEELAAYRTLIGAYAEAHPDRAVQLVEASDRKDLLARLATSIAGGAPPDLFLMNYRFYGQLAVKDAIEPLDERIAGSTVIEASDYYPVAMDAFKWGGKQLCLPQNVSSLAVYYNRTLFEKYGVAPPKAGWTWNDLLTTATAMTRDANGAVIRGTESEGAAQRPAVHGLGVEPSIIRLAPFVWSNGGEIVDDPARPTRLALDNPAAREALKNLVDLRLAYGVVPTDEEVESEDDESRFVNGRLAMLLQSRRSTPAFRRITTFDWDVAPLPRFREPASLLDADAYCMTRASKEKDAAWRFMEFALGPQGQRITARTGRDVPSLKEVAGSEAFLDPARRPRSSRVFLDAIPASRHVPVVSTWPKIEDATDAVLANALYRGLLPERVARDLDEATRPMFARADS